MKNKGKVLSLLMALLFMAPLVSGLFGFGSDALAVDSGNVTLLKK